MEWTSLRSSAAPRSAHFGVRPWKQWQTNHRPLWVPSVSAPPKAPRYLGLLQTGEAHPCPWPVMQPNLTQNPLRPQLHTTGVSSRSTFSAISLDEESHLPLEPNFSASIFSTYNSAGGADLPRLKNSRPDFTM